MQRPYCAILWIAGLQSANQVSAADSSELSSQRQRGLPESPHPTNFGRPQIAMKTDVRKILDSLEPAFHQRLYRTLEHLRRTSWPNPLRYLGSLEGETKRSQWEHPLRHDEEMTRSQAYTWAEDAVDRHYGSIPCVADGLCLIKQNADSLVAGALATLGACVEGLVEKQLRRAVLSRERLVQEWPWPLEVREGVCLHWLLALSPSPAPEPLFTQWPSGALGAVVAEWGQQWLTEHAHPLAEGSLTDVLSRAHRIPSLIFTVRPGLPFGMLVTPALALLYLLETEVKENQKRTFIAIDTCKEHTKLVEAWRDLPKAKDSKMHTAITNGRLELILPDAEEKRHFQLSLTLPDDPLASQVGAALRKWRSWIGLRHWVAFQSLITGNRRLGWVRWTVEEHLTAMGQRQEWRRRPDVRRDTAKMVELFTQIEIGVYDEKGKLRERRPLVLKSNTYERLVDGGWEIEGLELKVNPILYRGVRDPKTGELGKNWWPTPKELAHINHDKFGGAIALGTILPGRWRMELAKTSRTYIDLKGDSLLHACGLPYRRRNQVATWRSVARNLAELERRGGLQRWEWLGEPGLSTVCRLYAPQWAVDRIAHGVPPKEIAPGPTALTGAELKAWRAEHSLTQAQAASNLGVTDRTIRNAEKQPNRRLSKKIRAALASFSL